MFDLANDRLSYSELLRPDAGYTLDFAVGMTYSLDLEALLGVPVSMGMLDEADSESMSSPLFILEAIRKSSDRIALFCNAGCIKLPDKIQSVYSLLENSVFQVKLKQTSNFHPKIWVLKYSQDGSPSYIKLLVMSRNLTFDSSIDISAALRGEIGTEQGEKNRPLADFLIYVSRFSNGKKKQQVFALAEEVLKVPAFEVSPPFEDYDFYPIGIPGYGGKDFPLFDQKYDLFAVSPFLSDETIQKMTSFNGRRSLVTRKSSVTPAVMEAFENVYVTKDVLNDNEFGAKQDIHAKIYYTTTRDGNYLYLGSANASQNAFNKNIECLLRLRYKLYGMGYQRFSADFIPVENCPYEKLTSVPELPAEDKRKKEIDRAMREAVCALQHATVSSDGNHYSIQVYARSLKSGEDIKIAPLQRPDLVRPLSEENTFSELLLKELSEFFVLSLETQKLVVKLKASGMPKGRDEAIYRSIIDSRAKFMSYLSFVLSGDLSEASDGTDALAETMLQSEVLGFSKKSYSAIYEQMLRVFHQSPAKLKGIADMVQRLDAAVVGDEFRQMFAQFELAAKKVHR